MLGVMGYLVLWDWVLWDTWCYGMLGVTGCWVLRDAGCYGILGVMGCWVLWGTWCYGILGVIGCWMLWDTWCYGIMGVMGTAAKANSFERVTCPLTKRKNSGKVFKNKFCKK